MFLNTTRKYKLKLFAVCLIIIIAGCSKEVVTVNNSSPNEYINDKSNLIQTIRLSELKDNGFRFATDELSVRQDLYTTYYASKIKELFKVENNGELKLTSQDIDNLLFNENSQSNLMNIYYFVQIQKDKLDQKLIDRIESYVLSLQSLNGSFAYSKDVKKQVIMNHINEREILSTFFAVFTLDYLNKSIPNKNELNKWIKSNFSLSVIKNPSDISEAGYIVTLIKISKILNYEFNIDEQNKINEVVDFYNKEMDSRLTNDKDNIEVVFVNDVIELNRILHRNTDDKINKKIINVLSTLGSEDGTFRLNKSSNSDVLSTYLVLNFMNQFSYDIEPYSEIINTLQKFKLINNLYIPLGDVQSDILNTYYVFKISELLNIQDFNTSYRSFCKKQQLTSQNSISVRDILYLNEMGCIKDKSIYQIGIAKNVQKEINKLKEGNEFSLYNLKLLVTLYYQLGWNLDEELIDSVNDTIYNHSYSSSDLNQVLNASYTLDIISLIGVKDQKYVNKIQDYLFKSYGWILEGKSTNKILTISTILEALKSSNQYITEDLAKRTTDLIAESSISNGLIKSGDQIEDNPSIMSTYYALKTLSYFSNEMVGK